MADIFISYSQMDRARVERLVNALTAEGYKVWWDLQIRAGESFDQLIEDTLKRVKCVVAVWSRHSVKSEWVRAESAWAKDRDRLVSIRIDEGLELPLKFYHVHTKSMMDWQGGREDRAFRELVADIRKIAGPPTAFAPAQLLSRELPAAPPEVRQEREATEEEIRKGGEHAEHKNEGGVLAKQRVPPRSRLTRAVALGSLAVVVGVIAATMLIHRESDRERPMPAGVTPEQSTNESGYSMATEDTISVPESGSDTDRVVDSGKRAIEPYQPQWRAVQQALSDIGFDAGPADGVPGDKTHEAISLFQKSRGFQLTGELTEGQRARLLFDAKQAAEGQLGAESEAGTVLRDTLKDGSGGPEMVVIPAGKFSMGCVSGEGCSEDELPVRTVTFAKPFAIGKYEVTVAEWVQDCWNDSYRGAPGDGSAREDGDCARRVTRGGSWSYGPPALRSADRIKYLAVYQLDFLGFRLARDL